MNPIRHGAEMQHHRFGSTQREVLVIGRATWYIEDKDRDAAIDALRTGIDLRTSETDTAEMYGFRSCGGSGGRSDRRKA